MENNNNTTKNNNRDNRSGNLRDLSRASRPSGSHGASSHPNGRGPGHSSVRGDRGPSHRGGITRPNLQRPTQPSRLSEVLASQDVESFLSRSMPATGNDFRNNHGTINFNLNFVRTPSDIGTPSGVTNLQRLMSFLSQSMPATGNDFRNNHGTINFNFNIIGTPSDVANLQRLVPLNSLEAVTAPQQSSPHSAMPQPRPDLEPRRNCPDVRPSSNATAERPPHVAILPASRQERGSQNELRSFSPTQRPHMNQAGWRAYKRIRTCGNCGTVGHSVMDCLVAHKDGFIHACPICNMGNHTIDSCRHLSNINLFEELVKNRGNKPPIYTSTDWFQLWVSKGRPSMALPHSVEFSRKVAAGDGALMVSLGTHRPKTYIYKHPCDPLAEVSCLPPDPLTAPSMDPTTAANLSFPPQTPPTPPAPPAPPGDAPSMGLDNDGVTRPLLDAAQATMAQNAARSPPSPTVSSTGAVRNFPGSGRGRRPKRPAVGPPPVPMPPAADPLTNLGGDNCPNCGGKDTCMLDVGGCSMPCRACGDSEHTITYCLVRDTICRCEPIPRHVRSQCPVACRRCWVDKGCPTGIDPDIVKVPRVIDCKLHCGICDMNRDDPAHVHHVPYTGCQQTKCDNAHDGSLGQSETHYRQDCVDRLCAHHDCPTNGGALTAGTCQHCRKCGSETINVTGRDAHKCQWVPEWGMLDLAGKRILAAALRCIRNKAHHEARSSMDLVAVRKVGHQRLKSDYNAWIKNGSKGLDPHLTRPVVECQNCFKVIWNDGVYAEQKPGTGAWPPGF